MNDYRLKVFICVARNNSFSKASRELHISQPAVSKHIKELEEQYKIQLFRREASNIKLTAAGELLLIHAERITEYYNILLFELNQLKENYSGELNIGASTTISQYVIPALLAKYIKRFPDIKLNLYNGNTHEIENKLKSNYLDLGIVEGNKQDSNLHYEHFLDDEIVLVTRHNSIYSKYDEIEISKLLTLPFVFREFGSGTLNVIEEKLLEHKIKLSEFRIILRLGSSESIKSFLMQTDAVAFISIRAIINELKYKHLKIIDIKNFALFRSFRFVYAHGKQNLLANNFINFALSNSKEL